MHTATFIPLQIGIVYGLATVLLPLVAFFFLWSIRNNVRRIAADIERIREATENQESSKQR